jgi:hypothetical protein
MGMTKASLDFQIQQETQKAIGQLQHNMQQLDKILQIIDGNMRQSHLMLLQDITRLTVRVNFLLGEAKLGKTEEEAKEIETRFKAFAESEASKMQKEVAETIAAKEKMEEELAKTETPNVVQ